MTTSITILESNSDVSICVSVKDKELVSFPLRLTLPLISNLWIYNLRIVKISIQIIDVKVRSFLFLSSRNFLFLSRRDLNKCHLPKSFSKPFVATLLYHWSCIVSVNFDRSYFSEDVTAFTFNLPSLTHFPEPPVAAFNVTFQINQKLLLKSNLKKEICHGVLGTSETN